MEKLLFLPSNRFCGEILVKYRVIIDRVTCIACGAAPATCPEIYELGLDNGKNRVVDKYSVKTDENISIGEVPEELYECAKAGADVCPVNAIKIEKIEE
jgi:ferredoxin